MRIIGGTAKGRKLASFRGRSIRPTTDRVREAIFNILSQPEEIEFPFKKALDLFAGTGAMGIEALSRGAKTAVFVDRDPKAVNIIKENLELCRFTDRAKIIHMDAEPALNLLAKKEQRFDLILIDPPYEAAATDAALNCIDSRGLLNTEGIIVAESSKRMVLGGDLTGIELFDTRRYGDTIVSFYKNRWRQR